ncbi:unnamed protein product [Nesidiocoris tenuis]|uniref:Uncharacterized protein n=1 Tax=Nesidiocoris tenuis TaxID=355587 RepID=A0A6H5H5U2_9HEMI|nr:unnamed protein product [Nesidiocoris tenuis]
MGLFQEHGILIIFSSTRQAIDQGQGHFQVSLPAWSSLLTPTTNAFEHIHGNVCSFRVNLHCDEVNMPLKSLQFQMRLRRRGRIDLAGNTVNLGSIQDVWHGYFCVSKQIMFSEGHLGSSPLLLKAPCGHRAELDTKDLEGCLSFLRTKAIKFCFKHRRFTPSMRYSHNSIPYDPV